MTDRQTAIGQIKTIGYHLPLKPYILCCMVTFDYGLACRLAILAIKTNTFNNVLTMGMPT